MDLNLSVGLADYEVNGPGTMSGNDLMLLEKALEATDQLGSSASATSGAPLKVESLENNLKWLTFKESDVQFWKRIPKLPAFNTVEEYNQLVSPGSEVGGFNPEGVTPEIEDSIYARKSQLVKFLGVTKSVTHPMQLVNSNVPNLMQQEVRNGSLWILRKADRALVKANSSIIPEEFNGLEAQHFDGIGISMNDYYNDNEVVIDLRGKALKEKDIEAASLGIIENFGYGNLLMSAPVVLSNFVKRFHESKLITPNTPQITSGVMGQRVRTFASQFGDIELGYDKFMKTAAPRKVGTAKQHPNAPDAITPDVTTPVAVVTDASTKFADSAGDYFYAISPKNRYGEGAVTLMDSSAISVSVTQAVNLKFADGGGTYPATGYTVYRTKESGPSAGLFYPLFEVSKAQKVTGYDGGAAGLIRDRNRILPDTNTAILLQSDTDVYSFKQLAPLMKMDLAILGPAIRFMILLYGTPQLYAPKKMARLINVGADLT